jgi:hypothetical protein
MALGIFKVERIERYTVGVEAKSEYEALNSVQVMASEDMHYEDSEHTVEMVVPEYDWEYWFQLGSQGHYIFLDHSNEDRFAIADLSIRSMADPASTDDGLLLLDRRSPLTISEIPVFSPTGRRTVTPTSLEKSLELSRKLDWDIELPDGTVINVGMGTLNVGGSK